MQGVYVSSQWQPLVVLVCRCRSSLAASQPQEELNGLFTDQGQEIDPVAIVGGGRDKGEGFQLYPLDGEPPPKKPHANDQKKKESNQLPILLYHTLPCF